MAETSEKPWAPAPGDIPFTVTLLDPVGERHLAFDTETGRWHRLWRGRAPEPLHTGEALFLRPSDIDVVIKCSNSWITSHPAHPRAFTLTDELAEGTKQLVLHYAKLAGEPRRTAR